MTETDLTRAYWHAAYQAEWYDGNNPGKQVRLDKEAARLREEMRQKGFDPDQIDRHVRAGRSPHA